MRQRKGFTLIELMVALAILLVLTFMALSSFSIILAASKSNKNRETVVEDMSTVLDQLTKEVRQCVTQTSLHTAFVGITSPASAGATKRIDDVLATTSPHPGTGGAYVFDTSKDPILRFYTMTDDLNPSTAGDYGIYRISYTLGVSGTGVAQRYWADRNWQPCEILYTREKWTDKDKDWVVDSGELMTVVNTQSITGQVITNFTVIRPAWSDKVIQIVLEAMVKNTSGGGSTKITRIAQVTLRQ